MRLRATMRERPARSWRSPSGTRRPRAASWTRWSRRSRSWRRGSPRRPTRAGATGPSAPCYVHSNSKLERISNFYFSMKNSKAIFWKINNISLFIIFQLYLSRNDLKKFEKQGYFDLLRNNCWNSGKNSSTIVIREFWTTIMNNCKK